MTTQTLLATSILAISLALGGCGGGSSDSPSTQTPAPNKTLQLSGSVTDNQGQPLAGVAVSLGNQTATSNTRGEFSFTVSSSAQTITALFKKAGYLTTARDVPVVELNNKALTLNISLSPDQISQAFATSAGVNNLAVGDAKVSIPANAVVRADGSAYTGQVQLAATYYNPDSLTGAQAFAQPFAGENPNGSNRTGLITVGVLEVKLTDPTTGEKLQLKTGQTATLNFPASSTSQNLATIPLWFYDETKKIWIKEGQVSKQSDGSYQGQVSHFTLWNVDIPVENAATIKGCFEDAVSKQRLSLIYAQIQGRGFSNAGSANSNGEFSIKVPANTPLILSNLMPALGNFAAVNIPSLSANQTYQINSGACIAVSAGTTDTPPTINLPFPTLPPAPTPVTPTPTPTPTGTIIGYNFDFQTDDNTGELTDVVLFTIRASQTNGNASFSVSASSLYNKPVNLFGTANLQFSSLALTNQGLAVSAQTTIQNGSYQQIRYGTSLSSNQFSQRLGNGYASTMTLQNQSISGQNIAVRLVTDDTESVPEAVLTRLQQLPANQRTFANNTSCQIAGSSSQAVDAIEFDQLFSIPPSVGSFDQFTQMMIPTNRINGTWAQTPWAASTEQDSDHVGTAYVQYQNQLYNADYQFAYNTAQPVDECLWYNEATKDQIVAAIRAAYPQL